MDQKREDRIYDLQQTLMVLPVREWDAFLNVQCAGDLTLIPEILSRLAQINAGPSIRTLRLSIGRGIGTPLR